MNAIGSAAAFGERRWGMSMGSGSGVLEGGVEMFL